MFTKIDELIWTDTEYKKLSDDAKFLFIYVLSCPHRNMLGFYFLPIPYGSFDLGWESKRFEKGLRELLDKEFINYNFDTNIIFIKNFLKYNPLENPNQVKGAIKALNVLPTNGIDIELVEYLKTVNKPFLQPLIELLKERLAKQVDVDVDVEVDVEVKEEIDKTTDKDVDSHFEEVWKLYPSKKGKGQIYKTQKKELYKLGDEFKRCISRYINEVEKERLKGFKELKYQNGSTFFNSGYVDYLDDNYKELSKGEEGYGSDTNDGYEGLGLTVEDLQ